MEKAMGQLFGGVQELLLYVKCQKLLRVLRENLWRENKARI